MEIWPASGESSTFESGLAAAFDWWREAGVDRAFTDMPRSWLAAPETAAEPPKARAGNAAPAPAQLPTAIAPAVELDLPQDLAAFSAWWLSEPALDDGRTSGRVPPRGAAGAALMVLVPHPEREDVERLLSGPQGRLLDAMLAAMGLPAGAAYVASALPRHTPHADWSGIAARGMGAVLARHVRLAAPRRLIVFGAPIPPLLGHDPANRGDASQRFNHDGGSVPLLAERDLAALLERPRWKAAFWQRWLDWAAGEA